MPWLQLVFETTPDAAQPLSDALTAAGAAAVTMQDAADQPLYEPPPGATPLWLHTRVIGLFDADNYTPAIIPQLRQTLAPAALPAWDLLPLEEQDWERVWMDRFHPTRFGRQLWICPSWCAPPEPEAINILLDPGLAFGTGTHPTTALCLAWLDGHDCDGATVIDYGCGSGILAIAALKLGADTAWAVDNDPQALVATRDNAGRNGLAEQMHTALPTQLPAMQVPLLLANILAGPLMALAPRFAELVAPGGTVVLSGLLAEQAAEVSAAYAPWFDMESPVQQEQWIRLTGRRRA